MGKESVILVVDDEADILDLVAFHLERAGFKVLKAKDGEAALSLLWDENVDLLVLDLMLPGVSGLEVLKTLRENERTKNLPVILLTAKTAEVDKIVGFELGTDDYVCKPFSVKELIARVKALLKRSSSLTGAFTAEKFSVNFNNHKIMVEGKSVEFSPKEFAILEYLFQRRNTVISRDQILEKVWGMDTEVDGRVVDVNITRMREKMGQAKKLIKTVKGYGYMFDTGE
jgi:DNA-binding response OmpR family regulator